MSVQKSWSQVVEEAGANTYDFISRVSEELRKVECALWTKYPSLTTGYLPGTSGFHRAWFNDMCNDQPPPPPPTSPFTGGQCCDKAYTVTVNQDTRKCFNSAPIIQQTLVVNASLGTVKGLIYQPCIGNPSLTCLDIVTEECGGAVNYTTVWSSTVGLSPGACFTTNPLASNADFVDPAASNDAIVSVVPTDGSADTCGDPFPQYPPEPPLDLNDTSFDVTLNLGDNVDIDIHGDLIIEGNNTEYSFSAPRTWNILGINFQATVGGINIGSNNQTINFGGGSGTLSDGTKHPLPSDITPPLPPADIPAPTAENFDEDIKQESDPKEEEVGVEIEYVKITVTSYPVNTQTFAGGDAPTIRWMGWFTWKSVDVGRRKQFIEFDNQIFYAPQGATGYAYYLYPGVNGFATVFTKKPVQ